MWLALAFVSAFFLGCYDISKKKSVSENAVIPVLFLNTLFCSLLLLPLVVLSQLLPDTLIGTIGYVPSVSWETHGYIFIKSLIVLTSWIFGYFAVKHLPLTITGPINATRPVMTLMGALFIFGERLSLSMDRGNINPLLFHRYFVSLIYGKRRFQKGCGKWSLDSSSSCH